MHRHVILVAVAIVVVAACGKEARAPTSPEREAPRLARTPSSPAPNVTTTVFDLDSIGAPLLTRSDDLNGPLSASYVSSSGVTSHITSDGSWQLLLGSQTARHLYLVLAGQGIPLPDGFYAANVEAYSQCYDESNVQVSVLAMAAGTTNGNCSFGVDFSVGRMKYKLVMGPKFPGTGRASVRCNVVAGGQCASWLIMPNGGVIDAGVANLYHFANNGSLVFDGLYRNSYSVMALR